VIDARDLLLLLSYPSRTMASSRTEGRRQEELTKERQRMREQYEKQKAALVEETEKARPSSNRFVGQHDSMEDSLKRSTVGLVRLEDFQARRKEIQEAKEREAAMTSELKYVLLSQNTSYEEEMQEGTVRSDAVALV